MASASAGHTNRSSGLRFMITTSSTVTALLALLYAFGYGVYRTDLQHEANIRIYLSYLLPCDSKMILLKSTQRYWLPAINNCGRTRVLLAIKLRNSSYGRHHCLMAMCGMTGQLIFLLGKGLSKISAITLGLQESRLLKYSLTAVLLRQD